MMKYFVISLILFVEYFICIKDIYVYYYKCKVSEEYYSDKYYIPLCSYDVKYKTINYFGYFNYTNKRKYISEVVNIPLNKYKREVNIKVNISLKRTIMRKRKISLCLVSIYGNLSIINIIRTCLMYKSLGIEHITLYVSYYDDKYKKYYKWLKEQNWIDIIYFPLPMVSTFYYAQDAKLNHCINHYRYISTYVVITDVDEVIIPVKMKNLLEIINKYGKKNYVYSFKSVLFSVNSTKSNIFLANKIGCKIKRGYEKMIIRPEKVISIGAHYPKRWQEKGEILFVNTTDAYVRHVRVKNKYFSNLKCNFLHNDIYLLYLIKKIENIIAKI